MALDKTKKIIYYKLNSPYTEDYTKNCGLVGTEIDQNFFNLKEMHIADAKWDSVDKEIILTRVDGEEFRVKGLYDTLEHDFGTFDFQYDKNLGVLTIETPLAKYEVSGFFTDNKITLSSDETLSGDGCISNPLKVSSVAQTGTFKPVNCVVECLNGEKVENSLRKFNPVKGDRFITVEQISTFGKLYDYKGVQNLIKDLTKNSSEWRVPSKQDWDVMLTCVEGCVKTEDWHDSKVSNDDLGISAGQRLKSKNIWRVKNVDNTTDNYEDDYLYSTEGTDAIGFSVLPVGYGDENGNPSKGYGDYAAFWSSTVEDNKNDIFTKRFKYNKNTVYQATTEPTERLSLRLVKTFNGKNFNDVETINGMSYPCVLVTVPSDIKTELINGDKEGEKTELYATVWTQINIGFTNPDYLPEYEVVDTEWDGKENFETCYFVNDWDGFRWTKHELREGDSVVVKGEYNGVSMHEWRIINGVLVDTLDKIQDELKEIFENRFEKIEESIAEESEKSNERDDELTNLILTEQGRAIRAEESLLQKIEKETNRAESSENEIIHKIESESDKSLKRDKELSETILTEQERAIQSEESLSRKIEEESQRAKIVEESLASEIKLESERLSQAESLLSEKIEEEIKRAKNTEKVLEEKIDAETNRAISAEASLNEKIDTEIKGLEGVEKVLEEKIDAEIERALATEDVLKTEINKTRISAGLSEDGSYVQNISFEDRPIHYIAKAESLNDADVKLDVALQSLDTTINQEISKTNKLREDLETEIVRAEEIESGLRIDVDSANSKIDTFLLAADLTQDAIDTLREIQSYISEHGKEAAKMVAEIAINKEAIEKEVERAKTSEDEIIGVVNTLAKDTDIRIDAIDVLNEGLRRDLDNEISRATSSDSVLETRVTNEELRAQNTEKDLGNRIDAENTRAYNAEIALGSRIDAEIARAELIENELNTKVFEISNGLTTLEGITNDLRTDLDAEDARVETINTTLNTLNGQVISLQEKTSVLEGQTGELYVEVDKTNNNVSTIIKNLSDEVNARVSADTELRFSIDNLINNKVEKEDGKGLSANDFTDILLEKVNGVENGAQVNKIEKIYVDNILMDITDTKEVKLTMPEVPVKGVNVDDNILSLNGTELSANISFDYDSESKQLILYGKDTTKVISTVDVKEFVKDGMIESVEVLTLDNGKTVIRITWNTDGNKTITDVPADSLIDIYEAGDGIQEINNVFSVKLANVAENFLKVDANGLYTEGIKDYVVKSVSDCKEKVDGDITNLSGVVSDVQTEVEKVKTNISNLTTTITEINVDLGYTEDNIETLKGEIKSLQNKDTEIETLINNAFVPESGEGIDIVITSGTEVDRSKKISGNIKGYYTGAIKPESESNSDFSLLRMTETGHLYASNATSAMKHTDVDGNIHFLSTYINTFNEIVNKNVAEIAVLKDELTATKQEIITLKETLASLISGNNVEFMAMLRNNLINDTTFVGDTTDPTVEVVVTKGEKVLIKTREDAVFSGSVIE
jgi:uncharacterized protein (TIGR02145 family)